MLRQVQNAAEQPVGSETFATGERAGSITAVQLPDVPGRYVQLTARMANPGAIWWGNSAAVTKGAGTTTTTCGSPLWAGTSTPWIPIANLNKIWIICDNAADHLTYVVV